MMNTFKHLKKAHKKLNEKSKKETGEEKKTNGDKIMEDVENLEGDVDNVCEAIAEKDPFAAVLHIGSLVLKCATAAGLQVNPLLGLPIAVIGFIYKISKSLREKNKKEKTVNDTMDEYLSALGLSHSKGALNLLYNTILVETRLMEEWRRENYYDIDLTDQDVQKIFQELVNGTKESKEIYREEDVKYAMTKFRKPQDIRKWKGQLIKMLKDRKELQKMKDLDKETLDRHKNLIIEDWKIARAECGKNFEAFLKDFEQKRDPERKYDGKKLFKEFKNFLYILHIRSTYFRMVAVLVGNPEKLGCLHTTGDAILRKLRLHEDYVLDGLGVLFNASYNAKHVLCGIYTDAESEFLIKIIESLGSRDQFKPQLYNDPIKLRCLGSGRYLALKKKDVYTVESKKWDTYTALQLEHIAPYNGVYKIKGQNFDFGLRRFLSVNTPDGWFFVLADPERTEECWYNGTPKKNNNKKVVTNDKPWDSFCLWAVEYTTLNTQNLNIFTRPQAISMTVKVLRAKGLPKMDLQSKSDPYVKVIFKGTGIKHNEFKTQVIKDNHNPNWMSTYPKNEFSVLLTEFDSLKFIEFHLWDDDSEDNDRLDNNKYTNDDNEDDYIGCVTVHDPFDPKYSEDTWELIKKRYNVEYKRNGKLCFQIIYKEIHSNPTRY